MNTTAVPGAWGWALRGGGRAGHVEAATPFAGTTSQLCGLFPFAVSAGTDVRGVPLGRHLHTAEPIGLDPAHWLRTGLVSNTGVWVQGQPGIGKSSITKRMLTGLVGFGMRAIIPGDVKGEYTPLVTALDGTVWRIGRGLHSLNPLDAGPLRTASSSRERTQLLETVRARRLSLVEALITIVRRGDVTPTERRLLGAALDVAVDTDDNPVIPDVLRVLSQGPEPMRRIAACRGTSEYARVTRDLVNTLGLLCEGAIRGLFDRPSTVRTDHTSPALSLDISAFDDDEDDVVAAAMLCSWAWSAGLADADGGNEKRNIVQVQDELWRALRVAPGLVERSDRITRLGRHRGVISFQITHSLDDLEALPTESDRAKARGLASRNAVLLLGGLAEKELDGLARITSLTEGERALVTSWAAPPTWHSGRAHPGRGKYLIKSGQRVGLPVALSLTPTEAALYDTDRAFHRSERPR